MISHSWNLTPSKAVELQRRLKEKIRIEGLRTEIQFVAGADLSFNKLSKITFGGIVVFSFPELKIIEKVWIQSEVEFPYIPGLLSFREIPVLLKAFKKLKQKPDLMIMDGQGYAHPRRFGLACHFGLLTNTPSIGCAKAKLIGDYDPPGKNKGMNSSLIHKNEKIGDVLRTRNDVNPVFVSPGHLVNFNDCIKWVLNCTTKYRIPEPTRQAHLLVNKARETYYKNHS